MTQAFEPRSALMSRIAHANDESQRDNLLLMLGILDEQRAGFDSINDKLDDFLQDEHGLREAVLNGLAPTHEADHRWVREHQIESEINRKLLEEARPLMAYVRQQLDDEMDAHKRIKSLPARVLESSLTTIVTGAITSLGGLLLALYALK